VCAQIADCLIAVVAQRLRFNESYGIRVPVCEILVATHPVRNLIRQGQFFKLASALETGHADGSWTFRRYEKWLESRTDFFIPTGTESLDAAPRKAVAPDESAALQPLDHPEPEDGRERVPREKHAPSPVPGESVPEDVIVIEEPDEKSLGDLLRKLEPKRKGAASKGKGKGKKR
jgi:twitching motility protein PilT